MGGLLEDPDEVDLNDLRDIAEATEQNDLAAAIETLQEVHEEAEDTFEEDEIRLPFYEQDRELAFVLGMMVGGVLEADDEDDTEDEQTETVAVGAEQAQTVEA